jgi:hypothetical protein
VVFIFSILAALLSPARAAGTARAAFTFNATKPGVYTVKAGDLMADFEFTASATPPTTEPVATTITPPTPSQTMPSQPSSRTNWVLLGGIVVCVLVAGALAMVLVRRRG